GEIKLVATSKAQNFSVIPDLDPGAFTKDADYFYICHNNTIFGTKWPQLPETGGVPLVADISSSFLSEPMDVGKFGVMFGGAQKNVAPAGLTVAIVREDLLGRARKDIPTVMDWKTVVENDSMYNTPPCWPIYICKLVLEWIQTLGGLPALKARNEYKAGLLYDFIGKSAMFTNPVRPDCRSIMNVTFVAASEELNAAFVKAATAAGFVNLKGHRSVGGMRASIYNAMPVEGVEALVEFMAEFERKNG
ncbi:MAG: 3-phosphoserine/phosphohydroxythreonine transaminase, partial [Oscillospiraceae bacterium]|nr:3-phosphoserine/phosphohydroxythreonine transaminase [Oscillospiraceae bacterium]